MISRKYLQMNKRDRLNVIIPIYNPHEGWENNFAESIKRLKEELETADLKIILVNDGSSKPLGDINLLTSRYSFLNYYSYTENKGKGFAIRYGVNISDADYYVYTDIDFPFGYEVIVQTYNILKSTGTNIVVGTRDLSYFRMLPFKRRIYSVLLKELNYFITGFEIKDTQAGLKGLDNEARKILADTRTNTFLFELEFLKMSLKKGLQYKFIHVTCRPSIKFTDFRFRILYNETLCLFKLIFS